MKEVRQRISEKNISLIRKFLNPSFEPTDPVIPTGVCNTCRTYLTRADNTGKTEKLPKMLKYADIILPKTTRAIDCSRDCNCNICLTSRSLVQNKRIESEKLMKILDCLDLHQFQTCQTKHIWSRRKPLSLSVMFAYSRLDQASGINVLPVSLQTT